MNKASFKEIALLSSLSVTMFVVQYVHVMWELIAPLENSFWGSGTGIMVSEHMSAVYENHSRFYTDVLRIFPAGYSSLPDNEGETDEESNTESADS